MPIANDMKNIAEEIEVSYGERVAFLSDLSQDTNQTLKTFRREHQKMAGDLGDSLSSDQDSREKVVASLRGKNKRELKAMAEQLAHFLKQSTSQLSRFEKERQSVSKEMKEELTSTTRGRIEQVKKMLAAFSSEQEVQSRQLRHRLFSFQKELESTVKEMRAPVVRDLQEAKQNWQNLSRIMAAKRAGKAVTVAKRIEGVPKEEMAEAVEAFTAGGLKEQMLHLISNAGSGMKLATMGAILRIPYIRLAKPASELVNEGKIKKEDSRYFKEG